MKSAVQPKSIADDEFSNRIGEPSREAQDQLGILTLESGIASSDARDEGGSGRDMRFDGLLHFSPLLGYQSSPSTLHAH